MLKIRDRGYPPPPDLPDQGEVTTALAVMVGFGVVWTLL
jgi:hypothetical protein